MLLINTLSVLSLILSSSSALQIETLHQFPNGTRLENLVVLPNNSIIVSAINEANLYLLDPSSPQTPPVLIQHIPSHTAVLGLGLPTPDNLAVIAGNFSTTTGAITNGSWSILLLDISGFSPPTIIDEFPIPNAGLLNGLTTLPSSTSYLLIADSTLGVVWRLNILTGALDNFSSPLFDPVPPNTNAALNGIHAINSYLYFSNSNTATIGKIKITANGTSAGEQGEIITSDFRNYTYDDFYVGSDGVIFAASTTEDSVNKILENGTQSVVVQNTKGGLDHPVAVGFGVGSSEGNMYIVTAGTIVGVGGTGGGQVLKIVFGSH